MKFCFGKKDTERNLKIFLLACVGLGAFLHVYRYMLNRSLWVDEAMLVSSIIDRDLSNLVASPLDFAQSSPVLWLYIVKMITMILGPSELALRLSSLIAAFVSMLLVYLLLKNKTRQNQALFVTAIFSLTHMYIFYGNEFKPYMFDNMLCLLTLYVWQLYKDQKIALWKMVLIYAVIIWGSFLSVFLVAACMIIESITLFRKMIIEKNCRVVKKLCLCAIVLFSFVLNYVVWLSKSAGQAGSTHWDLIRFPLIPTSLSDISLII